MLVNGQEIPDYRVREFIRDLSYDRLFVQNLKRLPPLVHVDLGEQGSVLYEALTQLKNDKVVSLILDCGGVFKNDEEKQMALHYAVWSNSPAVLSRLVEIGAEVNGETKFGKTALMAATQARQVLVVEFLLLAGAEVNVQDHRGRSALHYLYHSEPHGEWNKINAIAKMLIDAGIDESLQACLGDTIGYTAADLVRVWLAFMVNRPDTYHQSIDFLFSEHNHF